MVISTPVLASTRLFLIQENQLNLFDSKEDMEDNLGLLKQIVTKVLEDAPVFAQLPFWPPLQMLRPGSSSASPCQALYDVLKAVFEASGYSVAVITTMQVDTHEPHEITILAAQSQFRLQGVH